MSLEREIGKAFRRMVFWRLVGDLCELPIRVLEACQFVFTSLIRWVASVNRSVFYMELEYARRYKALTGTDLAYAVGEVTRYSGLDPARAERGQRIMLDGGGLFFGGAPDEEDDEP